jgi:hypothetical protein
MLTCFACLRSFHTILQHMKASPQPIVDTCVHCGVDVQYRIDEARVPEATETPKPFAVSKSPNQPVSRDMPGVSVDASRVSQFSLIPPKVRNGTR